MFSPKYCPAYMTALAMCACAAVGLAEQDRSVPAWEEVHRGSGFTALAFSADGKLLAVSYHGDGRQPRGILLWKFGPGPKEVELVRALPTPAYASRFLAFSPDGKTLASAGETLGMNNDASEVKLWDVGAGKEKAVLKGPKDTATGLGFASDGALVTAAFDGGVIAVWNPISGSPVRTIDSKGQVFSMALMPKTHRAALGGCNGLITFVDLDSGKTTGRLQAHQDHVQAVAFSPSGKTLASCSGDINLWDAATGKKRRTLTAQARISLSPHPLVFSHDGKYLASVTGKVVVSGEAAEGKLNVIHVWEEATGKQVRTYRGHEESVDAVAFAPDGKTLVSGSRDRGILWDTKPAGK